MAVQRPFEIPKMYSQDMYCPDDSAVNGIINSRNSIGLPYGYAISLLAYTGMRDSEIINIKYNEWEIGKGKGIILHLSTTKNGRPRDVPLLKSGEWLFKEYVTKVRPGLIGTNESQWLFPQQKHHDKPILRKNVEYYMRDLRKELNNDKLTCHSLRRYYVTKLMANNIPEATVAKLIGHSNMRNFGRYYKPTADHLSEALGDL